jgi:hypothetical protein
MGQIAEPIEAVIISGPRRGEIVRLPEDAIPEVSDEDIELLNEALDQLIAAVDRYAAEVRTTIEAFREPREAA